MDVNHPIESRAIKRVSFERGIYSLSQGVLAPHEGNLYWNGMLIAESSAWPPERVNLMFRRVAARSTTSKVNGDVVPMPSSSYYHWLLEDLPAALSSKAMAPDATFVVGPNCPRYVSEFLVATGSKHEAHSKPVIADRFILTDKQGIIGTPQKSDIRLLMKMSDSLNVPESGPSRIYVSRRRSKRSPKWEGELESILEDLEVRVVLLEELSWVEQVSIFKGAKLIVGIHGAGLSNAVFSPPGAKLVELMDASYPNVCFEVLARQKKLKFERILFDSKSESCPEIEKVVL